MEEDNVLENSNVEVHTIEVDANTCGNCDECALKHEVTDLITRIGNSEYTVIQLTDLQENLYAWLCGSYNAIPKRDMDIYERQRRILEQTKSLVTKSKTWMTVAFIDLFIIAYLVFTSITH